jgi:hypothetical protein
MMNRNMRWMGILGFAIGLAANPALFAAGDEADAEQKQIEEEAAKEEADRAKGITHNRQVRFFGTVYLRTPGDTDLAEDVLGRFVTNDRDKKPKRTYLMKVGKAGTAGAALEAKLKKMNGKPTQLTGVLRVMDANGEAKYLFVQSIEGGGATRRVPERRSGSGL